MSVQCPCTLQWDANFPLKIVPSHGGSGPNPHLIHGWWWFLGSTQVLNPNSISIGAAIFAGLTRVTNRQTDRPRYSVCNNRPHLPMYYCDAADCDLIITVKSNDNHFKQNRHHAKRYQLQVQQSCPYFKLLSIVIEKQAAKHFSWKATLRRGGDFSLRKFNVTLHC